MLRCDPRTGDDGADLALGECGQLGERGHVGSHVEATRAVADVEADPQDHLEAIAVDEWPRAGGDVMTGAAAAGSRLAQVFVPRRRRGAELFLLLIALTLGIGAYALVGLGTSDGIPTDIGWYAAQLVAMAVLCHLRLACIVLSPARKAATLASCAPSSY